MGQTRKLVCKEFKPGTLVKVLMGQLRTRTKVSKSWYRVGVVLPMDKKLAARHLSSDKDAIIGDVCAKYSTGRVRFIYVNYTRELNPDLDKDALGKRFQHVSGVRVIKSLRRTLKQKK